MFLLRPEILRNRPFLHRRDRSMIGKVEICGVNTSKLKVLKNEETMALLKKANAI